MNVQRVGTVGSAETDMKCLCSLPVVDVARGVDEDEEDDEDEDELSSESEAESDDEDDFARRFLDFADDLLLLDLFTLVASSLSESEPLGYLRSVPESCKNERRGEAAVIGRG